MINDVGNLDTMTLKIQVKHKSNWHSEAVRRPRLRIAPTVSFFRPSFSASWRDLRWPWPLIVGTIAAAIDISVKLFDLGQTFTAFPRTLRDIHLRIPTYQYIIDNLTNIGKPPRRIFRDPRTITAMVPSQQTVDNVITIGIDFGTTYSGVAYTWSNKADKVKVITCSLATAKAAPPEFEQNVNNVAIDNSQNTTWQIAVTVALGSIIFMLTVWQVLKKFSGMERSQVDRVSWDSDSYSSSNEEKTPTSLSFGSQTNFLVYAGAGVTPESSRQCTESLKRLVGSNYAVYQIMKSSGATPFQRKHSGNIG
ncbi:hypothetical protein B0H65DRAFT_548364 [Neurospora tetraspora]|uniref:Biotin-protein ligase N-terminal domain-containing protein n=1 Tax=Neurospora tetraspora TaxID=94610 RepID=A0AAE0MR43_9PEZI|nr:hypothetical protein B0H65DRAFT_548364 [Neurospora tetraspora]